MGSGGQGQEVGGGGGRRWSEYECPEEGLLKRSRGNVRLLLIIVM